MAQATVLAVEQGWAGDRKRHRVQLTLANTNDTALASQFGLQRIEAIVPTGVTGNIQCNGEVNTITNYGAMAPAAIAAGGTSVTFSAQTATNAEVYVYGW